MYLLGGGFLAFMFTVVILAVIVPKAMSARRRKALEQILETYQQAQQALVRYVMLNRQCSEDAAFKRIATFVKNNMALADNGPIVSISDKQDLLDIARTILAREPDAIDKI
jgi:3-phosphoglycerate kinase